jgi:hypothetical protein
LTDSDGQAIEGRGSTQSGRRAHCKEIAATLDYKGALNGEDTRLKDLDRTALVVAVGSWTVGDARPTARGDTRCIRGRCRD